MSSNDMKRIFLYVLALALTGTACSKTEEARTAETGETVFQCTLGGTTKMSMGEKIGSQFKALWDTGDHLSIFSESGENLGAAVLVSGAGTNTGVFSLPEKIADGTKVTAVYGDLNIPQEQNRPAASDRSLVTKAMSALVEVREGASEPFTMSHAVSFVRVNIASTAFAGASLGSIIFRCPGARLNSMGGDYVRMNLTQPMTLNEAAQDCFLSVLPAELTGKDVYVAFSLTTAGGANYTIPVRFKGRSLEADKVNSFIFDNLSVDDCVEWFEPRDTRLMEVPTYAYGEANTFLIQCKSGQTYTGAEYIPDDAIPGEVSVSIKARGDFLSVIDPKGAEFEWARIGNTGTIYTMRTIGYSNGVDPTAYDIDYDGAYNVKVTCTGAFAGSPILLMKKDGKVLWSWTFWNIAADGTKFGEINEGGYRLANMDLGQATTQLATWAANNDPVYRTMFLYQYGRHIPVFTNTVITLNFPDNSQTGNIPAIWGPVTVAELISNPVGLVCNQTTGVELIPYCVDNSMAKAWGGCGATTGKKAVFDPCPKGWRVADKVALQAVKNAIRTFESATNYPGAYDGEGNFFSRSIYYQAKTTVNSAGKTVIQGSQSNTVLWSNYCAGPNTNSAYAILIGSSSIGEANSANKANCASVRCQVDEDNR